MKEHIKVGDLVIDNYGSEGIVVTTIEDIKQAESFTTGGDDFDVWIMRQSDSRVQEFIDKPWLEIFPLTGGSMYAPEGLCEKVRVATKADFEIALKNANEFAQEILKDISEVGE